MIKLSPVQSAGNAINLLVETTRIVTFIPFFLQFPPAMLLILSLSVPLSEAVAERNYL